MYSDRRTVSPDSHNGNHNHRRDRSEPEAEIVGGHDTACASRLIQLRQRVRALESQAAARDRALETLSNDLAAARTEIERLRRHLELAEQALLPAENRAANVQAGSERRWKSTAVVRMLRQVKRRVGGRRAVRSLYSGVAKRFA
jgi:uncharacterized coiled-coil protein SlyX